jgi:O-antigen ligase
MVKLRSFKFKRIDITQIVPFFIGTYLLFSFISITISQAFLFLSLVGCILVLIKQKKKPRFPDFFWPLGVFILLSFISSLFSVNPGLSLKESRGLLLFLVIPIVFNAFSHKRTVIRVNHALLASALISCLYSVFIFLFKAVPGERIAGFMGHYMTQAGLLLLFSVMSLSMLIFIRERTRFLWGAGLLLALFSITFTLTRSAWVGLIAAVILILALYKPKTLIIIPVAIGLFFLITPNHVKKRALSIFSLKNVTNQYRIEYMRAGLKIIGDYPLLGTGPDTVDLVFQNPKYELSEMAKRNVHLHNNVIQVAAERGIPALCAWIVFMAWAFLALIRRLKNKDPFYLAFSMAGLAAIVALMTAGLFEYNFGDSEVVILFLYMITVPFTLNDTGRSQTEQGR